MKKKIVFVVSFVLLAIASYLFLPLWGTSQTTQFSIQKALVQKV